MAAPALTVAAPPESLISVVLPVYNEAENIIPCLRQLWAALQDLPHEILVCYDFEGDTTLPAIRAMADCPPSVRLVRNDLGRGVACALRAGFAAARGDVVVTTMADLSDPSAVIPRMAGKIRTAGAHVVSGSRYMPGGSQTGGPKLKGLMSRVAGLMLHHLAGVGTHDSTTNFRAYSATFLRRTTVQSQLGFEVALELTVKAHLAGYKVDEVPSSWHDRTAGESRFKLWKWLPRYLHWFGKAMATPLMVWTAWAVAAAAGGTSLLSLATSIAGLLLLLAARRLRRRMSLVNLLVPLGMAALMTTPLGLMVRMVACAACWVACVTLAVTSGRRGPGASRRWI